MKNRPVYGRIPVDYAPMQDLSINIKTMLQDKFSAMKLLNFLQPLSKQYFACLITGLK